MKIKYLFFIFVFATSICSAQNSQEKKPVMKFLGAFDAGLPNVSIIKLLDTTDDVVCYVLMPDNAIRKQVDKEKWVYESNNVGSISCLKVIIPVVPMTPNKLKQNGGK
jgi:hypothetical protein